MLGGYGLGIMQMSSNQLLTLVFLLYIVQYPILPRFYRDFYGDLLYKGDYTTQLHVDFSKPLHKDPVIN